MSTRETNTATFHHDGHISEIKADSVIVTLDSNIHCESCHAKGACGVSGSHTKRIEVFNSDANFKLNDQVQVRLKKSTGMKAVLWAYIVPFFLMVSTLVVTSGFIKEWLAGLLSLLILMPYYLVLRVLSEPLKTVFKVSVLKP